MHCTTKQYNTTKEMKCNTMQWKKECFAAEDATWRSALIRVSKVDTLR